MLVFKSYNGHRLPFDSFEESIVSSLLFFATKRSKYSRRYVLKPSVTLPQETWSLHVT